MSFLGVLVVSVNVPIQEALFLAKVLSPMYSVLGRGHPECKCIMSMVGNGLFN